MVKKVLVTMSSFKWKTPPFGFDTESHFYELIDSNTYQGKPVESLVKTDQSL